MAKEHSEARRLVGRYLQHSKPIHWVNWASRCPDQQAKAQLEKALFQGGSLRDLTDPVVKSEVLEAISAAPAILDLVIADLAEEMRREQAKGEGRKRR